MNSCAGLLNCWEDMLTEDSILSKRAEKQPASLAGLARSLQAGASLVKT